MKPSASFTSTPHSNFLTFPTRNTKAMIKGFTKETQPLTEKEQSVIHLVTQLLLVSPHTFITAKKISEHVKTSSGVNLKGPRVRKVMNHIRVNGLVNNVIASSKGYKVASTFQEMKDYLVSLEERIKAQMALMNALKKQMDQTATHVSNVTTMPVQTYKEQKTGMMPGTRNI